MTFIVDGTNGLTFNNSTTQASAGVVLQCVSTAKTDTFTTSSLSYVDVTGLSVSITPKFSTSKILVMYQCGTGVDNSQQAVYMQLVRGSTAIFIGDTASLRPLGTSANGISSQYAVLTSGGSYLDSPATTSSTTYKIQIRTNAGLAAYVNRSVADRDNANYDIRTSSSITVMEIAA
jgi:hypothetical protein